jgi:hypothetical protein
MDLEGNSYGLIEVLPSPLPGKIKENHKSSFSKTSREVVRPINHILKGY